MIPIPRPSRSITGSSPPATTKDAAVVFVACPDCGLVSAYSALDIQKRPEGIPDPFEAEMCRFVILTIECDDKNCDPRTGVHTTIGSGKGMWKEKAHPIDWRFSPECICESGHRLVAHWKDYPRVTWEHLEYPF